MKNLITEDELLKFGFIKTNEPVVTYFKPIVGINSDDLKVVVTHERNKPEFALISEIFAIFLNCSLSELDTILNAIVSYQDNF